MQVKLKKKHKLIRAIHEKKDYKHYIEHNQSDENNEISGFFAKIRHWDWAYLCIL